MRIVFLGTPDFSVESLDTLVTNGFNIVGVVTMPDKPAGRGHKMFQSPVKQYAVEHNLHLMQPVKLKDPEFIAELQDLNADLFIVIAFRMLPEVVWQMPRLGTFNLHASLLPKYRGAAPINWAVINGDTRTGVTTFFLKHEIDTGDIIDQEEVAILPEENVGDVHDKLMHLGAELTLKTVNNIIDGTLTITPQDTLLQGKEPTPAPKIFRETCEIDWKQPAEKIHNLVRGLSPYPAAWTEMSIEGNKPATLKIYHTKVSDKLSDKEPGKAIIEKGSLFVTTGDKMLEILELQAAGKRRMATADYLRGLR